MANLPSDLGPVVRPSAAYFYSKDYEHRIDLAISVTRARLDPIDAVWDGYGYLHWSAFQPYNSVFTFQMPVPITQWVVDFELWRGQQKQDMRLLYPDLEADYSTGGNVRLVTDFRFEGGLVRRVRFPLSAMMTRGWDGGDDLTSGWHGHQFSLRWNMHRVRTLEHLGGQPVRHVTTGTVGTVDLGSPPVFRQSDIMALLDDEDRLREEIIRDDGDLYRAAPEVPMQPLPALWSDDAQVDYIFSVPLPSADVSIDAAATASAILVTMGMGIEGVHAELHDATTFLNQEHGDAAHPVNELLGLPLAAARHVLSGIIGVGETAVDEWVGGRDEKGDFIDAVAAANRIRGALSDFLMTEAATKIMTVYVSRLGSAVTSAGRAMKAADNFQLAWQEFYKAGSEDVEPTQEFDRQLTLEYYRSILLAQLEREEDSYDYSGWLPKRQLGGVPQDAH